MAFGKLGAIGAGFGHLGSLGRVSNSLPAPVLAMAGSWTSADNTPDFSATLPASIVAGDTLRYQLQAAGGNWSALLADVSHIISAPEDAIDTVDLAGSALADGNYEARANVTHGASTSAWSNTVSFTIASLDAATSAWIAAVVGGGGTVSSTQRGYVDTLIRGLKTDGLFTTLDCLWLLASENVTQAKYDIIAAGGSNLATTVIGSPTFTASQGYAAVTPDSDYLTTTYIPSSSKVHLAQNSATIGSYTRTAQTVRHALYGVTDGTNDLGGEQFRNISQVTSFLNDGDAAINVGGYTVGAAGLHVFTRTGATACEFFFNGASKGTSATASVGIPTKAMYLLTRNLNGSPGAGDTMQVSVFFIASGWNSTQAANFYTRVQAYMTSLGTQV